MIDNRKDYKLVLVIGNGFDLDLDLPTSYSDFMNSSLFLDFLQEETIRKYHKYEITKDNILQYLHQQKNLKNWIDIEVELKSLATKTTNDINEKGHTYPKKNVASEEIEQSFEVLRKQLCWYLNMMPYDFINKNSFSIRLLGIVNQYPELCEIISYNYTDINKLEDFVGDINIPIDHVHGTVRDRSLIIGFQDNVEIDKSFSFMIKSFSPYFRSHNVRRKLLEANEIIFFGHSLGETDYHYFEDLFKFQSQPELCKESKILRLFTYDEKSRIDILFQLRAMNNKRTDMLFELNDFEIYRTKDDSDRINNYFKQLNNRLYHKSLDGLK